MTINTAILTDEDIDLLLEALPAWEDHDVPVEMLGEMLGVASHVKGTDPSKGDQSGFEDALKQRMLRREAKLRNRHERSVMLQAKLIQLRTQRGVDEVTR